MKGMVVPNQIGNSVNLFSTYTAIGKKRSDQRHSLFFLVFSICVAILDTAERACNVMGDRSYLKDILYVCIDAFQFSDCFRICPDSDQMVDIMNIPI